MTPQKKRKIHQKYINIRNIYEPNLGASKYIRKILEDFKKDINSNTLILGDFNTTSQWIDLPHKISRRILCYLTIP